MCTHNHYVYNKYIHKRILIPCGKCPACLQEKANARAARIRSSFGPNDLGLFVTLTYDNEHVPCIHLDELKERSNISIYRGHSILAKKIGSVWCSDFPYDFDSSKLCRNVRNSPRSSEILGVPFYKDIQDFLKRLRINLYRKYDKNISIRYFATTELGETYFRPHAHLILIIPKETVEIVRTCIIESWKMCNRDRLCRGIEIARDVAKYVASYVNSPSGLPKIFLSTFKQKHANSKGFGVSSSVFDLPHIIACADRHDMSYSISPSSTLAGSTTFLLPKYALNRYFPLFKGFSRIPPSEICNVLQRPEKLVTLIHEPQFWKDRLIEQPDGPFVLESPIHRIIVQQSNAAAKYIRIFASRGIIKSIEDYYRDYERVWRSYESTKLRLWYSSFNSSNIDVFNHYDNVNELACGLVRSDLSELHTINEIPLNVSSLDLSLFLKENINKLSSFIDPNNLKPRVDKSLELTNQFYSTVKRKKVFAEVSNDLYHDI